MKLLWGSVVLAVIVSVLASGSKKDRHHHHDAALLGVHGVKSSGAQAPGGKASLDGATDKLQGVLDAVSASLKQVHGGYSKIKDQCMAEVQASAKRVQAQTVTIADLETSRTLNLERTAGLEASLANLVTQETDAHASYESSVAQRAGALQKHLSSHKATVEQAKAIGEVLEMMNQKRAMVTASQVDQKDMKVQPPVAGTSSGSALDFVIGVLSNIKDTGDAKAEKGSAEHNEDDADLERLVTSYKTSLQHIDKQYQTENARRMQAKVTARDAAEEKTLRGMLVNGEEKLDKEFFGLCGADGKGGSVPAALQAAEFLLSQFKHQSANVIQTMDALPDVVAAAAGAASFLSVEQQNQLRGGPQSVVVDTSKFATPEKTLEQPLQDLKSATVSAQESAARWVIAQAAKFKGDNATQQLAKKVVASFPNGVPAKQAYPARIVAPSQLVHTLIGTDSDKAYQNAVASLSKAAPDKAMAPDIMACVKDKQDLTDKIIAARKAARAARTDRMSAEARVTAVKTFRNVVKKQKDVLTAAQKTTEAGWKPLREVISTKSFETDLTDAVAEMKTIEKDVDTYIKSGGPPASAGLPTALKGISDTLGNVQKRLVNDMKVLDGTYTGALMISYPALINQLANKDTDLNSEGEAVADAAKISDESATKYEAAIKGLMLQRSGVEYRCLKAGTCANLHYQQCCSGSGSFMKKVGSWKECADHCEAMVKEGKQIAGCELTGLYKKDDVSGSGTCYAQTECKIKSSELQCAGSLCKALPAKK